MLLNGVECIQELSKLLKVLPMVQSLSLNLFSLSLDAYASRLNLQHFLVISILCFKFASKSDSVTLVTAFSR